MFSFIGMCSTILYGTLLTARGNMTFLNSVSAIGIVVNIAMNSYLIPEYGATGAAIATVITQSLISAIQFVYSIRILKIQFKLKDTAFFIGYVTVLIVGCYFFRANSALTFMALLFASLLSMFIFRIIDVKNLKRIIAQKV